MSNKNSDFDYKKIENIIGNSKDFNLDNLSIRDVGILASLVEKKTGIKYLRMEDERWGMKSV